MSVRNDRRDLALAVLSIGVVLFALLWIAERRAGRDGPQPRDAPLAEAPDDRTPVRIVDVLLDRERRAHLDLVFDRALGEHKVGEVFGRPPARLVPHTGGVWSWQAANVLRFTPTGRLAPATRYAIALLPAQLVPADHALVGEDVFEVQTDAFQVERALSHEEPEPDADHRVRLRGELRFNYPVEPRELAPRLSLADPDAPEGGGEVTIELETRHRAREIGWRSAPVEKGRAERALRLVVAGDLTPADGNVPLGADHSMELPLGSRDVLVVRDVAPRPGAEESALEIGFSAGIDADAVLEHLEIDPPVALRATASRNRVTLRGPLRPESRYALTLRAGLVAKDGAVLGEPWRREVRLAALPAAMGFRGEGMFLPARGARRLALETTNVERVTLTIDRVYRNNVLYLVQQQGYSVWQTRGHGAVARVFGDRLVEEEIEIGGPRNAVHTTEIAVDEKLGGHEPGFYRVAVQRPGSWALEQRWLLVTDLGIVAKRSDQDLLVWVSSFDDLQPVAGASVRVVSDQNQLVGRGRTDARGLLHLTEGRERFAEHRPAYVVVERGDDWSFIALDRTRVETSGLDVAGAPAPSAGYDAFVYGERDLYRPGETARGVAVVRDAALGVPPEMPLLLRHRDPRGHERGALRLALEAGGVAPFALALDEASPTGRHALELLVGDEVVGRYGFQVEEFVPDRIAVDIEGDDAAPVGPGRPLRYRVSSHYLFGPPAAGLDVESRVRLEAQPLSPPGFAGFEFGDPDRKFARRELLAREGTLDESGASAFHAEIPADLEVPASLVAVVTARVQERGGRGVSAERRVPVHPYPYYLGLRKVAEGHAEPGTRVAFELVGVAPDGSAAPTGALRVELLRDEWQTVLRRTPSGSYKYESERVSRQVALQSLPGGEARREFELEIPDDYGRYRVVVGDPETGAATRLLFYASGWGFAPWAIENPERIELDLERDDLRAGERAVVQVRAPFAGTLLLTVERDRVLHTVVRRMEGNTARIELPVREAWSPNVYVAATLVRSARALEPGASARAFGAVPLSVERERHRMPVRVTAPAEVRPRGPLELVAHAAPGSRVTVAAVDEGVLQLIAQQTPDPFAHFYRRRALGVGTHDIFADLLPDLAIENEAPAGGGLGAGRARMLRTEGIRRVKPVAFWSGVLTADARGEARARFELPEFQGSLRVMALAHRGADFGSATEHTRVRDPLVLLPTTPRFLSGGERAELPVTVRNDTGEARRVRVRMVATGPVAIEGPDAHEVELADGAETSLRFALATTAAQGEVTLRFVATAGDERAEAVRSLGLRPDLPARSVERAGALPAEGVRLEATEGLRAEGRHRSLRIAPSPLVGLYGSLRALLVYPYGCLEQTVSRAFPLVALGDWARRLEPVLLAERAPVAWVESAIRRVASMQLPEGGFSLWPRGREADPWASLYAGHFLVEAERAGHASADAALPGALAHAAREAVAKPRYSGPELERVVYALYVLARAGRPDRATMDFVRERHEEALTATQRVLLGAAYAAAGDPEMLPELAAAVEDADRVRRQTGGNFASTTRDRALLLLALLDAAPEDPRVPRLATRLARDATAERWSTQETAFALLALGQLERRAAEADYRGSVFVAGQRVGDFDPETAVFEDLPVEGAVEIRLEPGAAGAPAYYALHERGTPTDAAFAPASEGLEVERTWLTRDGRPLDALRVRQGDLVVARIRARSLEGRVENVALQQLLPAGLEIENPRLASSETLPWVGDADLAADYFDARDDRALIFTRLPSPKWRTAYLVLRAVVPGTYRLPPVQAEAMYAPELRATGPRGELVVESR